MAAALIQASAEESLEDRRAAGTLQPAELDELIARLCDNGEVARAEALQKGEWRRPVLEGR